MHELHRLHDVNGLAALERVDHLLQVVPVHAHELLQLGVRHTVALVVPRRVAARALSRRHVVQLALQRLRHLRLHRLAPDEVVRCLLLVQLRPEVLPIRAQRPEHDAERHVVANRVVMTLHQRVLIAHSTQLLEVARRVQHVQQRRGEDASQRAARLLRRSHRRDHDLLIGMHVARRRVLEHVVKVIQEGAVRQQHGLELVQVIAAAAQERRLEQLVRVRRLGVAGSSRDEGNVGSHHSDSVVDQLVRFSIAMRAQEIEEKQARSLADNVVRILLPVQELGNGLQTNDHHSEEQRTHSHRRTLRGTAPRCCQSLDRSCKTGGTPSLATCQSRQPHICQIASDHTQSRKPLCPSFRECRGPH